MTAINFFLRMAHSTIEQQRQTKNDMLKRHYCSRKCVTDSKNLFIIQSGNDQTFSLNVNTDNE